MQLSNILDKILHVQHWVLFVAESLIVVEVMVAEAAVITNKKYFDGFCSGWKLTAILHHHFQFYCHIKVCILRCLLSLPGFSFFFFKLQRNLRTVLRILSWRWQQLKYSIGFDLFQLDCDTLSVIKNFSHSKTCKWLTGIKSLQNYKSPLGIMATFNATLYSFIN